MTENTDRGGQRRGVARIMGIIRRRWWLVLLTTIVAGGLGFAASYLLEARYSAVA